jgi:predicted ATPase
VPEVWAPSLLELLGVVEDPAALAVLTPQERKQRTFAALQQMSLQGSRKQPLIFEVEDLHWIDPTSEEDLTALVERLPGAAILLLTTYRPGYQSPWLAKAYATQLPLAPLRPPESQQMVQTLLQGTPSTAALVPFILAKAGGNPLFLEELTRAAAAHEGDGGCWTVPETIQAVLAARLDQLPADEKHLLQVAAVIGPAVPFSLLQAVTELPEDAVQRHLTALRTARCLYETRLVPEPTYAFAHVLLQDVAYQTLLRRTRQHYHQRIAQVLEEQFPETADTQPELLAYHYTEAGLIAPAIAYWQQAGQRAVQRSAYTEAIVHFKQGLTVLTSLPEAPARWHQELDLQVALGSALMAVKGQGAPDVAHAYARARELCQQVGDTPQLLAVLRGLVPYYLTRGQLQESHQLAEQLLRLAEAQADPAPRMLAHFMLGQVMFYRGEPALSQTHHAQALALYTLQEAQALTVRYGLDLGVGSHSWLAWALWQLGAPTQALRHSQAARTLAHEGSHSVSLVFALLWAACVHLCRREVSAVHELAMASITLATEQGFTQRLAHATVLHGWALARQGQGEVGRAAIRQGLTASMATGSMLLQPYGLGLLAETYETGGHPDEGLAVLAEAQAVMAVTGVQWYAAELSRLKGALLLRQAVPDAAQAEACFQQALAVARQQQAKSWELRATMSLARLWQQQGKMAEACELLALIYNWFTKGFDTADLQEAKALLEELGG